MCKDRLAFMEDVCKKLFEVYCTSVRASHRVALNPDVCRDVGIQFGDLIHDEVTTTIHTLIHTALITIEDKDAERGMALRSSFLLRMQEMKTQGLSAIIFQDIGSNLN